MWPFSKTICESKPEEPQPIRFSAGDNDFLRARKMLRFAGLYNAERCGLASGVAEAIGIYRELDERYKQGQTP